MPVLRVGSDEEHRVAAHVVEDRERLIASIMGRLADVY